MTQLLDWLARRQSKQHGRDAQKREIARVLADAEERVNEQEAFTRRAVADNPITHRLRARTAIEEGRNVCEG